MSRGQMFAVLTGSILVLIASIFGLSPIEAPGAILDPTTSCGSAWTPSVSGVGPTGIMQCQLIGESRSTVAAALLICAAVFFVPVMTRQRAS